MSKYIIVDKIGKGNKVGKEYVFRYQVGEDATIYKCSMYCLDSCNRIGKFVFIEGRDYYNIDTKQDKDDFINEIKLFQRGSSYRKTHPINEDKLMKLQKLKLEYQHQIDSIDTQISDIETSMLEDKIKKYRDNIDEKSLSEFENELRKLLVNSKYTIGRSNSIIYGRGDLVIIDKTNNLPVKIITIYSDEVEYEYVSDYEIGKLL